MLGSRSWRAGLVALASLLVASGSPARAQSSALTVRQSLAELVEDAELIVRGHVISARVEPHPQFKNLDTVVVNFSVEETLKGSARKSLQFRQYVWDIRDRLNAAGYIKGQELLLMLNPVSQYGLTSPVGLEQGRFRILRDSKGRAAAVNGRGNAGLFDSAEQQARAKGVTLSQRALAMVRQTAAGPVSLSDLQDTIRTFAGARR